MAYWWLDRCLPSAVASLILTVPVWISHLLLKRHITKTADRQAAALSASREQEGGTREPA